MRNRIPTPARLLLAMLMAIIGVTAFAVSPAAADNEFDANGVIECIPKTDPDGAEYNFLSNETNPNGFTVTSRSHTDGPVTAQVAQTGFTYTVEYKDHTGNPGTVTAFIEPVGDCTPAPPKTLSVTATVECAVVDGAAEFTLWVTINNPDGLDIISQSHTNGQVVDNVDVTVTVRYTNDRWQEKTATAHAAATDDCSPVEEHEPKVKAWIECSVVNDAAEFRIYTEVVNANGATNIVFSPANNTVVNNAEQTVTVTYTSNIGESRTKTINVSATDDCTPDERQVMTISAYIECTVDKDTEVFVLHITENNPDGLTITDRSHTDGMEVTNEAFTVTYTYTDGAGDPQTATADVSPVASCGMPDGDIFESYPGGTWGGILTMLGAGLIGWLFISDTRRRRATLIS